MLTLYATATCPFCERVMKLAENLGIDLTVKDIEEDEAARDELVEHGGKEQVPYLVDQNRNESLFESSDIIEYLREHYAGANAAAGGSKPRVHISDSTCQSCEG